MRTLLQALTRYLLRHPGQLGLAVIGMAVGVAVIVAVDLANESARRAFNASLAAVTGKATHQIIGGPTGLDEELYIDLRLKGIRSIAPIVDGYVTVGGQMFQLLGIDIFAEGSFRDYRPAGNGVNVGDSALGLLIEPGGVLMVDRTARKLKLERGDAFTVEVAGRENHAVVVDLMDGEETNRGLDRVLIADIAVAQEWLGLVGRLSRIDVRPGGELQDETSLTALAELLPADARLVNAAGRNRATLEMSTGFNTSLTAMSLFALLVGIFLIYNSMSFMVLQRRPIIGVLRALGVTRGQLVAALLTEGLLVAAVGILLGVLLGVLLGEQLVVLVSRNLNDHYFVVRVTEVALSHSSIFKGVAAGLLATFVAVIIPAMEAASYPPRLSLDRSVVEERAHSLLPWLAFAAILIVLSAAVILITSKVSLVAGFVALFLTIVGAALLVPLIVKIVTPVLSIYVGMIAGLPGRMAVRGISRSLSRTGVAIAALTIAVAEIVGMGVMVGSFRDGVEDWLGNALRSDIYVTAPGPGGSRVERRIDPALVKRLIRVPGVSHYSASRRVRIETVSGPTRLQAVQMAPESYAGFELLSGDPGSIWPAFDAGEGVLISDPYAYRHGLSRGDSLTLPTILGKRNFTVLAIYRDYDSDQGVVTLSRAAYVQHWQDEAITSLGIYLEPDADNGTVIDALTQTAADHQALLVRSNQEIREWSLRIFDRTFVITDVLYWLAMIVAFVGVLGAVLALSLERGKELAILRALGMTRAQVASLVAIQCGTIGLLAGLLALPVGILSGWLLIHVINRRAFGWQIDMTVPGDTLVAALTIAILTALLASLYPAWRVTRWAPAATLREE